MNYLKIQLINKVNVYGLVEYFPYTDKPFFKTLDDISNDKMLLSLIAQSFAELFKDELNFINIPEYYKLITAVKYNSQKFTKINELIAKEIAKILNITFIDDYLIYDELPKVDIRDEYTKDNKCINIKLDSKYRESNILIFDCCCSTGAIFYNISNNIDYNKNNILLTYGVRFNGSQLNNTRILDINSSDYILNSKSIDNNGYIVRIYDLFDNKDVEIDFSESYTIGIGENGYGKSTAAKIALLAVKYVEHIKNKTIRKSEKYNYENQDSLKKELSSFFDIDSNDLFITDYIEETDFGFDTIKRLLARFHFSKVEVYCKDFYLGTINRNDVFNSDGLTYPKFNVGDKVYSKKYGYGIVSKSNAYDNEFFISENSVTVDFYPGSKRDINKTALFHVDKNNNIVNRKFIVEFVDNSDHKFAYTLYESDKDLDLSVLSDCNINQDLLSNIKHKIENFHEFLENNLFERFNNHSIIFSDDNIITIKIQNFTATDIIDKSNYKLNLVNTINYCDLVPNLTKVCNDFINDEQIKLFLDKITLKEYFDVVRKIILADNSIELLYSNIEYNSKKIFVFKYIHNELKKYLLDYIIDYNNNSNKLINCYIDEEIAYFNCAYFRSIISKPPRDRVDLNIYDNYVYDDVFDYEEDYHQTSEYDESKQEKYEKECYIIEREYNRIQEDQVNDPFAWNYDDPEDYNPYEDDCDSEPEYLEMDEYYYEDEYYEEEEDDDDLSYDDNDPSSILNCDKNFICNNPRYYYNYLVSDIEHLYESIDYNNKEIIFNKYDNFWDSDKIEIHRILTSFNEEITTDFFDIISKIIFFSKQSKNSKILYIDIGSKDNKYIKVKLDILLNATLRSKIDKMFVEILINNYQDINFGIYDIINNEDQYSELREIIKTLRKNGIKNDIDYIVTYGIFKLVESYKNSFISSNHILYEKLVNKYLINKTVKVYATNLVIVDSKNQFVPIDCLSTGEKNMLIIFALALSENKKMIILDEPDLSMSVDWQSKFLCDLFRYTENKYFIVTQSPLLIQKNNLSHLVKRLEFDIDDPINPTFDKVILLKK